jgi:menaquinone-dependent protoporphyrinogen oxidase
MGGAPPLERSQHMKVLISAASRHGATLEIAGAIKGVLEQADIEVDLIPPERVTTVEPYDAVVIGSAVYAGRWLAPARELIGREAVTLAGKPVWLFSSGPIGDPAKPVEAPAEGIELGRRVGAIEHAVFEGKLDRSRLGFAEKAIVQVVGAAAGDYRPWDAILDWARRIVAALPGGPMPVAAPGGSMP